MPMSAGQFGGDERARTAAAAAQQAQQQPSEAEMRRMAEQQLAQMQQADPAQIVAEVFNLMALGAQAKLGRPDARVLIDGLGGMVDACADRLADEVAEQMRDGVARLRAAQVEAEQEVAADDEDGGADDEDGGAGEQGDDRRMTDRLWLPGQGGPPPPTR